MDCKLRSHRNVGLVSAHAPASVPGANEDLLAIVSRVVRWLLGPDISQERGLELASLAIRVPFFTGPRLWNKERRSSDRQFPS
jgi:hypothetical protein